MAIGGHRLIIGGVFARTQSRLWMPTLILRLV